MIKKGMPGGENAYAFDKIYTGVSGNDQHNAQDADVANKFYNLATEFYEYGCVARPANASCASSSVGVSHARFLWRSWGDSFHFGWRARWEPHRQAILNSQNFVAQKLQVKDMDRVLDVGCGIGGPLRGVVRATGANVTGLTINKHQVQRAREITSKLTPWMQARSHFVVQDYLNIKGMEENAYDAAFYMESSLHTEQRQKTFSEVFKLLKPGGRLVAMEYVLLPGWDANNKEHQELMRMHLHGNGAAKTPTIAEDLAQIRGAGFEIIEHFDFMERGKEIYGEDEFPWWGDLQFNWRFHLLPAHPWVRRPLAAILDTLARIGIVPADVAKAADLMNVGGDGLSGLGKVGAITPQYYVGARKPLAPAAAAAPKK